MACGRTLGTLTLAVATLRRNVVNMEDKYAGYDRKRLKAVNADGDEEREAKFVQGVKFDADRCKARVNDTIRKCLDHVVYYVKQEVVSCDYYIKMINKDISDCSQKNQASLMSILTIFEDCAKKCEGVITKVKAIKI